MRQPPPNAIVTNYLKEGGDLGCVWNVNVCMGDLRVWRRPIGIIENLLNVFRF
jgi:hypothetical protein